MQNLKSKTKIETNSQIQRIIWWLPKGEEFGGDGWNRWKRLRGEVQTSRYKINKSHYGCDVQHRNCEVKWSESRSVMSDSLQSHGLHTPWNSPGQNTGVGSLSLLQGIFPTQRSKPGLLHCRWILHQLSHKGSPRILEWVAYPFSSGSSRPRNWTRVSCIAGRFFINWAMRFFINWAMREAPIGTIVNKVGITLYGDRW